MENNIKKAYATKDYDGHWYVIPFEMKEEFIKMCEEAYASEDFDAFSENFDKYMTGGDLNLIELYANF